MSRVSCAEFQNRQGLRLSGVLHEPDPPDARGVCVLLLSPGIKGRVGPHRLYLKMAARLVAMGFHVLRFDYHGLGDSEGVLAENLLADVYNSIQSGRYVEDTRAAMDWLQGTRGVRHFVASGLCGGAISGLLTARVDDRIRSVLALGMPVALEGDPERWGLYLTRGQLEQLRKGYLRKLLDPRAWVRFLSGRSSYDVVWKALARRGRSPGGEARKAQTPDNTNPLFAPAFLSVLSSGRPIVTIFSGTDRLLWEFQEKFADRHTAELERLKDFHQSYTIEDANHILSDPGATEQMLLIAARWLDSVHPSPSKTSPRQAAL